MKIADLDQNTTHVLSQTLNEDKRKTYLSGFPILIKGIPDDLDAFTLHECWKYYKQHYTNLNGDALSEETKQRISRNSPHDALLRFFSSHLIQLFAMFIKMTSMHEKQIGDRTSVVMRFTFNRIRSDQLSICVVPGGKWWVLNIPTDSNKMVKWFGDLIKGNHFGKCVLVELYTVKHPKYLSVKNEK